MFKCSKNKFWLENPQNLLCSSKLVPLEGMTYAEKLNAITRLVFIIFIILLLLGFKDSFYFLLLSMIFIIILYYLQRTKMESYSENFKYAPVSAQTQNKVHKHYNLAWEIPEDKLWCNTEKNLDSLSPSLEKKLVCKNPYFTKEGVFNNPKYVSKNQKLVGQANPKTLIAPVIVPKLANLDYWKTNNLVTHSSINEESNIDNYLSGYEVTYKCNQDVTENYHNKKIHYIEKSTGDLDFKTRDIKYDYPYLKAPKGDIVVLPNGSGQVNTACGYNPEQLLEANIPANLPASMIEQDPSMSEYNKNIFTQTLQPGVYTTNQVNEPINSNIGISFTQQFGPITKQTSPITDEILYTEHDPRIIDTDTFGPAKNSNIENVTEANIYDPRFSGYGTSYRAYNDENLGQTKFYYDDVNAVRMPNYLVRSQIDNENFADSYGPIPEGNEFGNKYNTNIRKLANNAWMDNSLDFRNDLQERLMRKANARAWQQKVAPIRSSGQRMGGGLHKIV